MDNLTIKSFNKPINWGKTVQNKSTHKEKSSCLNWVDIENLYQVCQLQDQASNVTNEINESFESEFNMKLELIIRTNRQSSASDIIESDLTQENNEECKKRHHEQPQQLAFKRSNTSYRSIRKSFTELIRENEKSKKYRNNRKSTRIYSMICLKRSLITPLLKNANREDQKLVNINYLGSSYSKSFKIDKKMLACELIVLAIQEFKRTKDFDQSLLKYSNFTLAYQLISYEDYCDFSAFSSKRNSVVQKQPHFIEQQYPYIYDGEESIQDRRIEFDLGTKISFSNLTLVTNEVNNYGLDLSIIERTFEQHPNFIIILIEDQKNETFYNIKCNPKDTIEVIFTELSRKAGLKNMKNECYFTLKYECVNYEWAEPIPMQFPINLLPIHWLVIQFKFDSTWQTTSGSYHHKEGQYSPDCKLSTVKSQHISFIDTIEKIEKLPIMFNYQEFSMLKAEQDGCLNEVQIGIDYFDLYYFYRGKKNRKCTLNRLTKAVVKFILQDSYSGQSKDYKRIQTCSIVSVIVKQNSILEIKYLKTAEHYKKKVFKIPEAKKNEDKQIQEQYQLNLSDAAKKLQFILEQRRKQYSLLD